ncbi:MAG: hypothetical protein VB108_07460 [Anaerolineaceae bacterium]|nr:hypothetical protein [Anaerolineaceae bacterium]
MAENAGLVLSLILLVVFLVLALFLARLNIAKQQKMLMQTSPKLRYPFPQSSRMPPGLMQPANVSLQGMQAVICRNYADWLERYILTEKDPRRAFLRTGTAKRLLKYEYLSTSFGQGLAMLLQTLMAGEDPQAQVLFDRLLFSTIIRPSFDHEDLSSWQMAPDGRSPRLNADLHAEAWVGFATLMAMAQWGDSVRVDYLVTSNAHLTALNEVMNRSREDLGEAVFAPHFIKTFAEAQPEKNWGELANKLDLETLKLLAEAEWTGDGGNEDASLALQLLNLGLARLLGGPEWTPPLQRKLDALTRKAYAHFLEPLGAETLSADYPKAFSNLALLSCSAPLAMALGDKDLLGNFWTALEYNQPAKNDPIGASLRLLAMHALAGSIWFGDVQDLDALDKNKQSAPEN